MSESDNSILTHYITNNSSDIYCIKNLPPEVIAVLFAYVSRSPLSFKENLSKLIQEGDLDIWNNISNTSSQKDDRNILSAANEKAREFHEKWVIGYGHSSVAEHADLKYALENVSIIASKVIEDCRLASFTEKSTRYQVFNSGKFYFPENIAKSQYNDKTRLLIDDLFNLYQEMYNPVCAYFEQNIPGKSKSIYKSKTCDVIRYLLPAGTLTSIGMSVNAREAAYAIVKFRSHPLKEMNKIGDMMLDEGLKICPTLLKYTEPTSYKQKLYSMENEIHKKYLISERTESAAKKYYNNVRLINFPEDAETKLAAAILYEKSQIDYNQAYSIADKMEYHEKEELLDYFLKDRTEHQPLPREAEHISMQMEILIDYGAFRDIQRHRIATQTNPLFSNKWGYELPDDLFNIDKKYLEKYINIMERSKEIYALLSDSFPHEASYFLPLAFRKRVLFTWNLREIDYFIRLRGRPQGHSSYRKIANSIYDIIKEKSPLIAKYIIR